ncbi:hypothetical protein MNBD_ALPHA11-1725 [hydrothermal vent metagenome]|uniref:Uncharacterized protein n=1 Tax=hydrothermal vent metagenome TaxID=652676 RepID=A0A3B0T6Z8_9ZZZZ
MNERAVSDRLKNDLAGIFRRQQCQTRHQLDQVLASNIIKSQKNLFSKFYRLIKA